MMKKILFSMSLAAMAISVCGQDTESALDRNVTVEREFQPVIQSAGKINQTPEVVEESITTVEVNYSDYTSTLSPDYNVNKLLSQPTRFTEPIPLNGLIRAGIGHTNTLFDFTYRKSDKKHNILDVYAHHHAEWGRKAHERTRLGLEFRHQFLEAEVYFSAEGSNEFYTRYGRYFNGGNHLSVEHFSEMKDSLARQNIWQGGAKLGVRSRDNSDWQYDARFSYNAYGAIGWATEHQLRTSLQGAWHSGEHTVGASVDVLNLLYELQIELPIGKTNVPRHSFQIEPYYEYAGRRFSIHAGVHLDVLLNKGTMLSATENVAFAPSPDIRFEAQIAPKWLTIYGKADGSFARGSIQPFVNANRFMTILPALYSRHLASYTPIDAELGFHIKAHDNLLVELHAGYAYQMYQKNVIAELKGVAIGNEGQLKYCYTNLDRWKVGAVVSYHYQDIIDVHVWGDYYIWDVKSVEFGGESAYFPVLLYPNARLTDGRVYDRPDWRLGARIDGRIDRNWSLYTTLDVAGSRWAAVVDETGHSRDERLRPLVDWNLGAKYEWHKYNLDFFAQLNNVICRYNDIYYGYRSEGTNFLLGATWRF